jgi:hypothetical protein
VKKLSTISELLIKIGADSSGLRKELGESKTAINQTFGDVKPLDTMQGALTSTTSKVESLIGSFTKFAGVAAGGFGLTSLISGAVAAGESTYQLSQRMGVTAAQAGEFKRILSLTGGDADAASKAIMKLDKTLTGGGSAAQKTQQIFDALGISLKDQQGHLLPLNQQMEQLAEGYKKAEKAGYGQEFIMNTLGAKGLSLTQTLREYAEAKEKAAQVKSSGMIDPKQMHELDQEMKLVNMQFGQLKVAGGAALAPLAKEFMPVVLKGLSEAAVFIKNNSTQIKTLTTDLVKLYAIYKSIQAVRAISTKAGSAVKTTIGKALGNNAEVAEAEKTQAEITKVQQRAITRRMTAMQAVANKEIKAYERTVQKMEATEAEKTRLVTEFTTQRTIALEEAQLKERAAMEKTFLSYQTQKAREVEIAAEAEQAKAGAAEKAAVQISEANTAAGASASRIVEGNALAAESEVAKADAATVASGRIVEANVAASTATAETTAKQEALTASEIAAGSAATAAGEKSVAASTVATAATEGTTVATKGLTTATVAQEGAASRSTATMTAGAISATSKVRSLAAAVLALASSWWAAAAAFAAYQGAKAAEAYAEKKGQETYDLNGVRYYHNESDGRWYTHETDPNNMTVEPDNIGGSENYAGSFLNTWAIGTHNDSQNMSLVTDIDTIKQLNGQEAKRYHESDVGKAKDQAEEAANQALRAQSMAEAISLADPGMGIAPGGGSGGGGGASSGGGSAGPVETPATPMRTKWSFEDDPELTQWAKEIEYAAAYHGIDAGILAAIIKHESHGDANVWSSDHAHWGLGQISEDIANDPNLGGGRGYGPGSDPNDNIMASAAYLAYLAKQYGNDPEMMISAYNLGHADPSANRGYVSTVEGYYNSFTTSQVPIQGSTGATQAQPVAYDIPVGDLAAYIAANNFWDGQAWTGSLGSDAAGWCDDWAHEVYRQMFDALGKEDVFGSGVVNDSNFRALGAYHEANINDIGAQLQPGDLVDTPGHVGIYLGNNMVRSRQSSMGVHDLTLQDFDATFGGIQGYGSIAEATGGMTAKSTLIGRTMTQTNRAAEEAARKLKQAQDEAKKLSIEMQSAVFDNDALEYQKEWAKFTGDIKKRKQEINKLAAVPGMSKETIAALNKQLDEYTDSMHRKFIKKWVDAWNDAELASRAALAQQHHDYEESADIEYQQTVIKLDREREKKEKELMHDKNDYEMRQRISDWYYAQVDEAQDKQRKAKQEAHDKYVEYLVEEGNLAQLVAYIGTPVIKADGTAEKSKGMKAGEESLNREAERKLAKEYVKIWQDAHGSMIGYIADVSDTLYSTMTDSMTEFIRGTKGAKAALQDFGNSVLNMMAKIAAQRLAASWMTSILGIFSGSRGGTSAAYNFGGTQHSNTFGFAGVSPATQFTSGLANTASFSSHLKVPGFASGGIVTAPTLAMIGEGGEHEAVIPLNDHNLRAMGGNGSKGGGVIVNITNKTNSEVSVQRSGFNGDLGKWVLDVVVDGAQRDRNGFGRNLKTALKGTM